MELKSRQKGQLIKYQTRTLNVLHINSNILVKHFESHFSLLFNSLVSTILQFAGPRPCIQYTVYILQPYVVDSHEAPVGFILVDKRTSGLANTACDHLTGLGPIGL